MDVGIPFKITSESMKDEDKPGGKHFFLVYFVEHADNNTLNCLKKDRKKRTVFEKEMSQFRINGEDTMTMLNIDDLKGHGGSAVDGILSSTGWTKSAMAAKRNKFKSSTFAATIHCATKRRVTAVDHALDIFNNRLSRAQCINHFFVIISKDVLKYIAHKIIMEDKEQENNPYPSRLRGRGVEVSKTLFYKNKVIERTDMS